MTHRRSRPISATAAFRYQALELDPPTLEQTPLIPAQAGIHGPELGPRFRGDERNECTLIQRKPKPRAMMPRSTSVVPPWMVSLGAIKVAKRSCSSKVAR